MSRSRPANAAEVEIVAHGHIPNDLVEYARHKVLEVSRRTREPLLHISIELTVSDDPDNRRALGPDTGAKNWIAGRHLTSRPANLRTEGRLIIGTHDVDDPGVFPVLLTPQGGMSTSIVGPPKPVR